MSALRADEQARLAQVAQLLVPGARMTAALPLAPALLDRIRGALAALDPEDLESSLAALVAGGSADAQALLLAVSATHYADPDVRAALGYPGPQPIALPPLPDPADAELDAALQRVRERGPIYRDA